jgi:hypothetical protein
MSASNAANGAGQQVSGYPYSASFPLLTIPMTRAAPSRHAFQPLLRALQSGVPRLVIETGQEPLILCFKRQGELIHDPECAQHFKAHEDGVFRRCETLQGGAQGFLWTYYCPLDQLPAQLKRDLPHFTRTQWSNLLLDAVWQIERHTGVAVRSDPSSQPQTATPTAIRRRREKIHAHKRSLNARFLPRLAAKCP